MEIDRDVIGKLQKWREKKSRKPLIIRGARQIGKTWVMKKFGEENYSNVAYFNFDSSEELCAEFEKTKNPHRLIGILKLYTSVPIVPGETLIIFDEIQQSNKALNSLKYFCEEASEYHVMAAGSLLGVSLSKGDSFPVGKVEFLNMYPVTFREFLRADSPKMCQYVDEMLEAAPLPEIVFNHLSESWRRYQVCGGMPAAASAMLDGLGMAEVETRQQEVLTSYSLDFAKHAPSKDIPRISAIWNSIPSQLARENRKFVYKLVKSGARAREYEDSLLWLEHAGMICRVFCTSLPNLPLSAYDDVSAFKIYLSDAGLLRRMASLPAEVIYTDSPLYTHFKGAMAENAVLQSLMSQLECLPRYWTSEATAEVDFVCQVGADIVPIEVKSGSSVRAKSLSVYDKRFAPRQMVCYSMNNVRCDGRLLNLPIFLADWTTKLLACAKSCGDVPTIPEYPLNFKYPHQ
jgi:predicted AAA+ superfamily ATPase